MWIGLYREDDLCDQGNWVILPIYDKKNWIWVCVDKTVVKVAIPFGLFGGEEHQ